MAVVSYKCPQCGARLVYDGSSQDLHCEYCDGNFDVESVKADPTLFIEEKEDEPVLDSVYQNNTSGDKFTLNTCNSCGGEVIGDSNTVATCCPFCGNTAILSKMLEGEFSPDTVVPFKVSKERAKEKYKEYFDKRLLLPGDFLNNSKIESITGVYVPFWLYDYDVEVDCQYEGKKIKSWTQGDVRYEETSHYDVSRKGTIDFRNVMTDGSKKMDDKLMEAIEPYDMKDAVKFDMAYLSGFLADKYDESAEECQPRADKEVEKGVDNYVRQSIAGYDKVMEKRADATVMDMKSRYAMLPVWLVSTQYKEKIYTFAMNGQTEKFVGDMPVSKAKKNGMALIVFLIILLLGLFIYPPRLQMYAVFTAVILDIIILNSLTRKMKPVAMQNGRVNSALAPEGFKISRQEDIFRNTTTSSSRIPRGTMAPGIDNTTVGGDFRTGDMHGERKDNIRRGAEIFGALLSASARSGTSSRSRSSSSRTRISSSRSSSSRSSSRSSGGRRR